MTKTVGLTKAEARQIARSIVRLSFGALPEGKLRRFYKHQISALAQLTSEYQQPMGPALLAAMEETLSRAEKARALVKDHIGATHQ